MDNYDNNDYDEPYSNRWWMDFVWIGGLCALVALGYFLPRWLPFDPKL